MRALRRDPAFAFAAIGTLALGIGANTAIFSVINAVLLRPLPYPHPGRIVQLLEVLRGEKVPYTSAPRFQAYREQSQLFDLVAAYDWRGSAPITLVAGDRPEQFRGARVSADYFPLFGAAFVAGRPFTAEEDRPGGPRLAVLSAGLWQRRFASARAVVGASISLAGDPYTVIGVASIPDSNVDVWLPVQVDPASMDQGQYYFAAARLMPGVTLDRARAALAIAADAYRRKFPDALRSGDSFTAEPFDRYLTWDTRLPLFILFGAVVCVLSMACANVANLLLARAAGRRREMAIRAAIGASRGHIVRQLLAESLTLSTIGGVVGLALGPIAVRALLAGAVDLPRIGPDAAAVSLDARVLAFTVLLSLLTGVFFGLAPAIHASRVDLLTALKDVSSSPARHCARALFIVAQVAVAFVLLTVAGLLFRTFVALRNVAPGFDAHRVVTMESPLDGVRIDAVQACEERLAAIPGVQSVAVAPSAPLESTIGVAFRIAGRPLAGRKFHGGGWWRYVTWRYFDLYRIPVLRGRAFTARDTASAPPVVIIDESMARRFWPSSNPIGERIRLDNGDPHSTEPYREIVGVVADVRELGLREEPGAATYVPLPQVPEDVLALVRRVGPLTWAVRARAADAALAAAVRRQIENSGLSVGRIRSMDDVVSHSTARDRVSAVLLGIFAAVAILLASIGLYGVISYSIEQRAREFGIRLALGDSPSGLRRRIVRYAMALAAVGLAIGVLAALAATRLMATLLFGVRPADAPMFALAALLIAVVALLAALVPARRIGRADPLAVLRAE